MPTKSFVISKSTGPAVFCGDVEEVAVLIGTVNVHTSERIKIIWLTTDWIQVVISGVIKYAKLDTSI
jgi:hypothetical protein